MSDAPYPWWPRIHWWLSMRTGRRPGDRWLTVLRRRSWSAVWHFYTWTLWRSGRGPRCGDYICDRPEDWPQGKVPAEIVRFWEQVK
jgi:hypothetical protein